MENKNYSSLYRIIHWSIAISMLLILITIFLRMTWMNKVYMADIIQDYLTANDLSLSQNQVTTLAKQIRKPMWNWHLYIGYVLTVLFIFRFSLPVFGFVKFQNPLKKKILLKEKIQYWIYIMFYVFITISLITGLIIEFGPSNFKKTMEAIHVLSIYYLVVYLIFHFGGIIIAEFTNQRGIVSKMIGGNKNIQ